MQVRNVARDLVGYAALVESLNLTTRRPTIHAVIDSAVSTRSETTVGDSELMAFAPRYRPDSTLIGHLQFALRYEGLNLEILSLAFEKIDTAEIETALADQPESAYARRIGYLYEWLSGKQIKASVAPRAAYIKVLDEKLQFGLDSDIKDKKFRVINNLPGNRRFCPLVRKTKQLQVLIDKNLKKSTDDTLAKYTDSTLLSRAAAFFYLKETHSSFEVEREKPSPTRAQRFADLLREAENDVPLAEERFVQLQNAVVDPRFAEFSYRNQQNWVGQDLGYRKKIDFVPPRPEDVRDLMEGLVDFSEVIRKRPQCMDPVVAAAAIAFGFVFIHPFVDGNGRLHRYLIHDVLSATGFTPKGIVLPVSAVILAQLDKYIEALEHFSRRVMERTTYNPDPPGTPATGNDAIYFRYFDATDQAWFLYWALEKTVKHDLEEEIRFLIGFDTAYKALGGILDWPAHSLDLFIRLVHQNDGSLSKTKRQSHFSWMTDDEVKHGEAEVGDAFHQSK